MKKTRVFLILISLLGIFSCSGECYFDGEICRKDVEYAGKPSMDLFRKNGNDLFLIKPSDTEIAFYIDSLQLGDNLYVAFQNYNGELICEKKDYIYSVNVNYIVNVYEIKKTNKDKVLIKIHVKSLKGLEEWVNNLKIDQSIPLACEDGKLGYSNWKRY